MREEGSEEFRSRFGAAPETAARAPGRVNLIGEHTDYNGGLVLPCAIDRDTRVLLRSRTDGRVNVYSREWREEQAFDATRPARRGGWLDYVQGVFQALAARGYAPGGFDIAIASDVPPESGLASSAALELALVTAIDHRLGLGLEARERCAVAHAAEVEFVGVPCGIMDQYVVGLARAGTALRIDCRTRAVETIAFPGDRLGLLVADSGVRRALGDGGLAERARECAAVLASARRAGAVCDSGAGLSALEPAQLEALAADLPAVLVRRARFVLGENRRVEATCAALRAGDLAAVGAQLREGMRCLREDFDVSTPELDALCEAGDAAPGVYGSRLTGAGFGGCTLHAVDPARAQAAAAFIADDFERRFDRRPKILPVIPADGASARRAAD